jgi:hypothetical protein
MVEQFLIEVINDLCLLRWWIRNVLRRGSNSQRLLPFGNYLDLILVVYTYVHVLDFMALDAMTELADKSYPYLRIILELLFFVQAWPIGHFNLTHVSKMASHNRSVRVRL